MRSPDSREALETGVKDKDSRVREAVARMMGNFEKDGRAGAILKDILENDDSYAAEASAAESLARIKVPDAFETLKKKLDTHPYRTVANGIYSAFNILEDKNAIPLALEDSAYGKPDALRIAAVNTLSRLGRGNKEVYKRLIEITEDPNVFMRARAIRALGALKDPEVMPKLEEIAARAGHGGRFGEAGVADAAVEAMEQIRIDMNARVDSAKLQAEIDELKRSNQRLGQQVEELQKRAK
jgi:HEAT repeat protein